MTSRLPPNSIRLYHRGTPEGRDLYPVVINERFSRTQNAPWPRRVVTGPVGADAEEFISSWTQDDYSGGFGILDANESTDTSRIAFGVIDGRRPKSMCNPPETVEITDPVGWTPTGPFYPLGDIGTQFYGAWANGIAGWNHAAGTPAWHTTQNAWPASFVLLGKPVMFCGGLFCPGGAQGFVRLSELTAATGTLTVAQLTTVHAVQFGLHDGKLWALDTDNHLWQLTSVGAIAGATTLANWGSSTAAGTETGAFEKDAFTNAFTLDTSLTPTQLIEYPRADGEQALWCITRAQGAYLLNPDEPRWIKSSVRAGAHPDWGIAADVFRDGEDLFIAAGGLDVTRFTTANVEVPLSGPSKDQGVPPEYQGTIQDLCSERSTLYALVKAGTGLAAGAPANAFVLQSTETTYNGIALFGPEQVAVDSAGKVYIADFGNDRLVILTSAGVYENSITGLNDISGVCVDSSNNIYVVFINGALKSVRKYNSSLVAQWTSVVAANAHIATDNTHFYVTQSSADLVSKHLCSTGALVTSWGTTGTGDNHYDTPYGIAVSGGEVYVVDLANSRVKVTTTAGVYVRQWATNAGCRGLALDASGDVWVCDYANNQLVRTSNAGVAQTTIAQSSPQGVGVTSGDILWVSTGTGTLVAWDEETVSSDAVVSMNWLGAWTGTAWCALWESAVSMTPTWMRIAMKGDYAVWWGNTDGTAYRQLLPPPFFNPAARVTLGVYPFAPTGWMETVRFDAQMGGWDKVAAHLFAMLDYAAADTYVDISYRTDADQFDSGLLYPPYRPWKRVDHIGRTLCRFDDAEVDPISGGTWQEGESFQWIQFRYDFVRGDDRYKSPIWLWHSMHFVPVPQDAATFALKIPVNFERSVYNRSPNEMTQTLRNLGTTRPFLHLQIGNERPSQPDWQVFFRVKVTQVKSEFVTGADNNLDEVISLSLVEIGESSNLHTTLAQDIP